MMDVLARLTLHALVALLLLAGCDPIYYAAMEQIGREKRHILTGRVEAGREAQQAAEEQFQTTLEEFKALTGFDGGDLEDTYEDLSSSFERSEARADEVRERIDAIDRVANDLFAEWEDEIEQISDRGLRGQSRQRLRETRAQYERYIAAMRRAEAKMEPVLTAFRDQVLFLKHNLNARAIGSLGSNVREIERDVDALVRDMKASIAEADRFLATMQG